MWNQDPRMAGGGNLYKTESHCPGPKMWNQDPRLAGGGNLYKTESHCPRPKMWNQDPRMAGWQLFLFGYNTGQFGYALSYHFGWRHSIQKQMIAKNVPMTKIPNKGTTFLRLLLDFDELSS